MKIRIKEASIRFRLSKSEVAQLVSSGRIVEETPFTERTFKYALQRTEQGSALSADFTGDMITMHVPQPLIHDWDKNSLVSIDAHMPLPSGGSLYLLLEKDFQCIDKTNEDQSDNYINPAQSC